MSLVHVRPAQPVDLGLARRVGRSRRIEALPAFASIDGAALGGIDRLVTVHDALNRGHTVVGATSTASADSFFLFSSPDLVVGLPGEHERAGNPFREGAFL